MAHRHDPAHDRTSHDRTTQTELPLDTLFQALSDARRRATIRYLCKAEPPVPLDSLVDYVVTATTDHAADAVPDEVREEVLMSLVHNHLPRLDEAAIIEYDADARTVSFAENVAAVTPHLHLAQQLD